MKILQIFGAVVGIHVLALILIFAIPGCSSSNVPAPSPGDTAVAPTPATTPSVSAPTMAAPAPTPMPTTTAPASSPAVTFNPDAAATATVRYVPTRPNTPAAGTLIAEPVVDVMPVTTYTVKSGESLWTIAKKHNLSAAQLAAANSLKVDSVIKPGQKLVLPGRPASPTAAATANPAAAQGRTAETVAARPAASSASGGGQVKHTVKSGETLGAIARTYGVKVSDIANANNITDPAKVKAGTELVIPGWDSANGKALKNGATKGAAAGARQGAGAPATINVENTPPRIAPQVPVISIDDGANPIVPAPKR